MTLHPDPNEIKTTHTLPGFSFDATARPAAEDTLAGVAQPDGSHEELSHEDANMSAVTQPLEPVGETGADHEITAEQAGKVGEAPVAEATGNSIFRIFRRPAVAIPTAIGAIIVLGGGAAAAFGGGDSQETKTGTATDPATSPAAAVSTANIPASGDTLPASPTDTMVLQSTAANQAPATAQATTPAQASAAETSAAATTGFRDGKGAGDPDGTQPAIPATPTAGAEQGTGTPEAIVNPDGTVELPASMAKNPEALGKALITQSFANWANAGVTAKVVEDTYDLMVGRNGKPSLGQDAISTMAKEIAQNNKAKFANDIFIAGWQDKSHLADKANVWATNNTAYVGREIHTAAPDNMPGVTTDAGNPKNLPLYKETYTVLDVSEIPSSQDGTIVIRIKYHVLGNASETALTTVDFEGPVNADYTGDQTFTLVQQPNDNGTRVLKVSDIVDN